MIWVHQRKQSDVLPATYSALRLVNFAVSKFGSLFFRFAIFSRALVKRTVSFFKVASCLFLVKLASCQNCGLQEPQMAFFRKW